MTKTCYRTLVRNLTEMRTLFRMVILRRHLTSGSDVAFDPVVDVAVKVLHWQTVRQLEESGIGLDTTLLL